MFTAAIGETFKPRTPDVIDQTVRYVCFTDRPSMVPAPYECVLVSTTEAPSLASRRIKILQEHPVLREADATVWHDASYRLIRDLAWARNKLRDADLVGLRNVKRSALEAEAMMIARYGYVTPDTASAIIAEYRTAGFALESDDDGERLTSGGLLARRVSPAIATFDAIWWDEVQRWGGRDQGCLDFAAWRAGLRVRHLSGSVRANVYAGWRAGATDKAVPV